MTNLRCKVCKVVFASRSSFNYHVRNEVCEKNQKYKCDVCNKTFSHKKNLTRHQLDYCKGPPDYESSDSDSDANSTDEDPDKTEIMASFAKMRAEMEAQMEAPLVF